MKNRGALVLIEQAIMLLVFALAAVLCLRAFVWADTTSKEISARDQAIVRAQSAVEVLKACNGDMEEAAGMFGGTWDGRVWTVCFDEQWEQTETGGEYRLAAASAEGENPYLGAASIGVFRGETCLAQLDAAWQEVTADG